MQRHYPPPPRKHQPPPPPPPPKATKPFRMEQTVVAGCFVPAQDRYWNERESLAQLQPWRAVSVSETQADAFRKVLCSTVPFVPHYTMAKSCTQLKRERMINQQQGTPKDGAAPASVFTPNANIAINGVCFRSLPSDMHFAVQHFRQANAGPMAATQELPSLHDLLPTSVESTATSPSYMSITMGPQQQPKLTGGALLEKYCIALESLLFAERKETLLLYERYSQYKCTTLTFPPKSPEGRTYCSIEIAGIADAAPSVKAGDILLIRPIELTQKYDVRRPIPKMGVLEIQCQVETVKRSRGTNEQGVTEKDCIQAMWLEQHQVVDFASRGYTVPRALQMPNMPVNVRIVPSPFPFVRCLTAVDWLRATILSMQPVENPQQEPHPLQELLFPTRAPILPPLEDSDLFFSDDANTNDQLNGQQENFVRLMMQRTIHPTTDNIRGPLVLTGPAGTGKTRTMLSAIQRILSLNHHPLNGAHSNRQQILVCTPSHTAANVITRRLGKFLRASKLFRLLDASRLSNTIPADLTPFCRQDEQTGTFVMPPSKEMFQFDVIVCTCSDAHLLYRSGFTNQQLRTHRQNIVAGFQSQFAACGMPMAEDVTTNATAPHFTHLFIDEAAQATEAETLVPISVVADPGGLQKVEVALVGDPRQLSPQVFCSKASAAGLGQSWMERLLRQPLDCTGGGSATLLGPNLNIMEELLRFSLQSQSSLSVFLTINYRGHASFLALPSALFYSDLLQSAPRSQLPGKSVKIPGVIPLKPQEWLEKLRMVESLSVPVIPRADDGGDDVVLEEMLVPTKQYGFPIHFRGVVGKDVSVTVHSGFTGDSWMNQEEANTVVEIIKTLVSKNSDGVAVAKRSIGVMAPFRGQVDLIRKMLRLDGLGSVDVGTIEDYQAVEWDVIILTLTRSMSELVPHDIARRLGVFGQPKRSNVALTRAENMFIVVGNPNTMMDHFVWRQFLLFCHRNGLWYGAKNDTKLVRSNAVVTTNIQELSRVSDKQVDGRSLSLPQPPSDINHHGVIVSSLERLLRSSSIV